MIFMCLSVASYTELCSIPETISIPLMINKQWQRPGAEFGGGGNFFRGPRFLNDVSFGTNFHFHGTNF